MAGGLRAVGIVAGSRGEAARVGWSRCGAAGRAVAQHPAEAHPHGGNIR